MISIEFLRVFIPALGLVAVAFIGLRPKKVSPEQLMSDELKRMFERIGGLEESNRELRKELRELQRRVDVSYYKLHRVKGYAYTLETHIHHTTGTPYERPEDVDAIFKEQ